jgi:hypothetical protein
VCHVSAVSRGRSPGLFIPQLGPLSNVITGKAVNSSFCLSPILMGWWFAQRNDVIKVVIAAVRDRQHHQHYKGHWIFVCFVVMLKLLGFEISTQVKKTTCIANFHVAIFCFFM